MARRGWTRSIVYAVLGAAGAAAAQFGLGYGLAVIAWLPAVTGENRAAWTSSLGWATFIGATSVVIGATIGDRAGWGARSGRLQRSAWCLVMALGASIGALVSVPLVAVPASRAQLSDTFAPHLLAAIYAAIGVLIGLVVAVAALAARAVGTNVLVTAAWLWILAIVAVSGGIAAGHIDHADLGVWKFTDEGPAIGPFYLPGVLILLGGALLVGGLAAFARAVRGDGRFGVAISGAAGPILVTAAYAIAAPVAASAPFEVVSAARTAPIMIAAGLIGSVLVAAVGGVSRPKRRRTQPEAGSAGKRASAGPDAVKPEVPAPPTPPTSASHGPSPYGSSQYGSSSYTATASVPAAFRLDPGQDRQ
jgi:MFS family permease